MTKRCPRCKTEDLSKFGRNNSKKDKLQVYCRECISQNSQKRNYEVHLIEAYIKHRQQEPA